MVIDNKEYEITEKYSKFNENILQIKLKGINNVTNMMGLFKECSSLSSLPDISNWNTKNVTNMNSMFTGCNDSLIIPSKFK